MYTYLHTFSRAFVVSSSQLGFASVLALVYCLVQMLVLVGLIVQMAQNQYPIYCDPNALFFLFVAFTFILCGVLHPREIMSVLCGFVYYLAIPTMYMILMIYSICNLHIVSWGTREVKKSPAELQREQQAAERRAAENATTSKKGGSKGLFADAQSQMVVGLNKVRFMVDFVA